MIIGLITGKLFRQFFEEQNWKLNRIGFLTPQMTGDEFYVHECKYQAEMVNGMRVYLVHSTYITYRCQLQNLKYRTSQLVTRRDGQNMDVNKIQFREKLH